MGMGRDLTEPQIQAIARGKARGDSNAEIAQRAGCSVTVVDHATADKRIGPLITALKERSREKLMDGWDKAVDGMLKDLDDNNPDVRIRTRSQLLKYIEAGEVATKIADLTGGDATFEEVLIAWRRKSSS